MLLTATRRLLSAAGPRYVNWIFASNFQPAALVWLTHRTPSNAIYTHTSQLIMHSCGLISDSYPTKSIHYTSFHLLRVITLQGVIIIILLLWCSFNILTSRDHHSAGINDASPLLAFNHLFRPGRWCVMWMGIWNRLHSLTHSFRLISFPEKSTITSSSSVFAGSNC